MPKAPIRSGLLAMYCRASKSDRAVGVEVVEPDPEPEPELEPEPEPEPELEE